MMTRIAPLGTVLFILTLSLSSDLATAAQHAGTWASGSGQGYTEFRTESGASNITISCDYGASIDHSRTSVYVEIDGKPLPANSVLEFEVNGQSLVFPSDSSGGVFFADCVGCAEKFQELWRLLREGRQLEMADTPSFP